MNLYMNAEIQHYETLRWHAQDIFLLVILHLLVFILVLFVFFLSVARDGRSLVLLALCL